MAITDLNAFIKAYFASHQCTVLQNQDGILTVQLNEKMDRALMNRPFYWHYVKATGADGVPMQLTLITNNENRDAKGEHIHFGSPRLQQIISHLKNNEQFAKLFEQVETSVHTPLYPWLLINIKISYEGKQKKDEVFSIGLNLVNGMMKQDMMANLENRCLNMTISDYCYPISPIIRPMSGFSRIEAVIDQYIKNQSHEWADEAIQTLKGEVQLLHHFYTGSDETEAEQKEKEIKEITERYEPRITYKVINGGLLYLREETAKK